MDRLSLYYSRAIHSLPVRFLPSSVRIQYGYLSNLVFLVDLKTPSSIQVTNRWN
jgi:hypothetical protein